jgi:hypothetical protein
MTDEQVPESGSQAVLRAKLPVHHFQVAGLIY